MNTFQELNLNPAINRALTELGFEKPTPVQAQALPVLLGTDTDYLGLAATGTGKTAAFGIPLLQKLDVSQKRLQAVVLCPTRELAVQVAEQLSLLGKHMGVHVPAIYGGTAYRDQIYSLRGGAQIIVATPGRLIDHMNKGNVQLQLVKHVVLDEADRMISMGFKEELEMILKAVPRKGSQRWLFSATMPPYLQKIVAEYLITPQTTKRENHTVLSATVRQIYFTVRDMNKPKGICKIIDACEDFHGIIFCQTKQTVIDLTQFLKARRYAVDCLHGDREQRDRERTLQMFREQKVTILVCTDVAARGLDVPDLTHVINFTLPLEKDSYIHRIGRTGRNGKPGLAMSLVAPGQIHLIPRLENLTRTKWESGIFPNRKEISAKKLGRFLPQFEKATGHERAIEALGEEWTTRLEAMSKQEIASRFLAIALPELFQEEEAPEAEQLPDRRAQARELRDQQRGGYQHFDGPRREQRPFQNDRSFSRPFHKPNREEARPNYPIPKKRDLTTPAGAIRTKPPEDAIIDVEAIERDAREREAKKREARFDQTAPGPRRFIPRPAAVEGAPAGKKPYGPRKPFGKPAWQARGPKPGGPSRYEQRQRP